MEKILSSAKFQNDEEIVTEIEVVKEIDSDDSSHEIYSLDNEIELLQEKIAKLDNKIDRYTDHTDKIDCVFAASSGLLCGLIDAFFVGEFSFSNGMSIAKEKIEQKVIDTAKKYGYEGGKRGENKGIFSLQGAIKYLEEKFKMPSDPLEHKFGGTRQHHLRDFSHHHSIIGLFFSILTQFTGKAYGTDSNGRFLILDVDNEMIGKDMKRKWAIGVTDWALHLVSDMHGSNSTPGAGTGIPGPILSFLKSISALPIFGKPKHVEGELADPNFLSKFCAKLYNGTLFASRDENGNLVPVKIDLRGEMAIANELGQQAKPVILNEVLVRSFYLIRRFFMEIKEKNVHSWKDLSKINWQKVVPCANRTINHMMLIASGTFVAVDFADAAIRSAIKSGVEPHAFLANLALRINYPGIGRFVIALGAEECMIIKQNHLRTERMALMTEMLMASNIKVFYHQKEMWIAASHAEEALADLYETAEVCSKSILVLFNDMANDLNEISDYSEGINQHNSWIIDYLNKK